MDQSAIKLIQDTAIAAQSGLKTKYPTIALPSDIRIHDLEHYQPQRNRFRGNMATGDLADFINYSNHMKGEACYISTESMSAKTFFNIGTITAPGHADHTATLTMATSPAYAELLKRNGERLDQKTAAEWLEDWRENIQAKGQEDEAGARDNISIIKAINAVRNITIKASREAEHTDSDFGASRSTMDRIEASAKDQLPAGFIFTCNPYEGLAPRQFFLRMSILTGGSEPAIKLRLIQLEKHQNEMAIELKEILASKLDETITCYIGSFKP